MIRRLSFLVGLVMLCAACAMGQNPPPAPTFTVTVQPVMWRIAHNNEAGTDAVGTLKLTPRLTLRSDNYIAPNPGISANTAGVQFQQVLKDADYQVGAYGGVGAISSSITSHFAANYGGFINMDIAGSKTYTWNIVDAGGIFGKVSDGGVDTMNSFHIATAIKISF